jgi:two-component system, chemotaxis family, response regulator Rcp1
MPDADAVILLVDDNDTDIELTQLSFERSGFAVELRVVKDGEQCIAFLRKTGVYADAPTPLLILLDLHMPRMGGLEVLKEINECPQLRMHPVVVLTTSGHEADVCEAYRHRCSGYVVKPIGFTAFAEAIRLLLTYWLTLISLPPTDTSSTGSWIRL